MSEIDDSLLIQRTRAGDHEAFGELVRRYQGAVFNVCYRMAGEQREAEDLAQEAFIRAYQRLDSFELGRPFSPWLRKLAANLCLNRLERVRPPHVQLDEQRDQQPPGWGDDPELALEAAERRRALRAAIAALPLHHRAIVELRHFQELSYDEIASTLGLPLSDVKSQLFRARKQLAKLLNPEVL